MKQAYLKKINLRNYRNLSELSLSCAPGINIIVGPNGSGKTNILESMSLLSPGKGLKSAHFDDLCRDGSDSWQAAFDIQSKLGSAEIVSSFSLRAKSRKITYNGSSVSSAELPNLLNVVWLTPQMEDLFLSSPGNRRRFLDRIVYNFNAKHAQSIAKYEHYVRERTKILQDRDYLSQSSWLTSLEEKIAIEARVIDGSRRDAMSLMQRAIDDLNTPFPKADLQISDLHEAQNDWADFIKEYMAIMANNRQKDSYSGRASFGVHKSDMIVVHKKQGRQARFCSTGEQKALLISVILASIEFILLSAKATPILLLDELFVHLDDVRKKHLAEYIISGKLQTFITTTDIVGIEELAENANIIEL
ncbi:MAG: DNA replication/repair protein RecF [Rickettsiaceae bacterium]|nr:DNA replication/repair protein RecF [Rickettsiaceae bacterium]